VKGPNTSCVTRTKASGAKPAETASRRRSVFGSNSGMAVSGTKSATGHLLGAAGGLEAIFTILALRDQVAPPTLNLNSPDPAGIGIDFVANTARSLPMEFAISNGFGFGGVNASALFRRWDA